MHVPPKTWCLACLLLFALHGCQSDETQPNWQLDDSPESDTQSTPPDAWSDSAGTDAEGADTPSESREWRKLSGFSSGHLIGELDGQLFARVGTGPNYGDQTSQPVRVTSDGKSWRSARDNEVWQFIQRHPERLATVGYADNKQRRYLLGELDDDREADLFVAPAGTSNFTEEPIDIDFPGHIATLNDHLLVNFKRGFYGKLKKRTGPNQWVDISPPGPSGDAGVRGFDVVGDRIIARINADSGSPFVMSEDAGKTWRPLDNEFRPETPIEDWAQVGVHKYVWGKWVDQGGQTGEPGIARLTYSGDFEKVGAGAALMDDLMRGTLVTLGDTLYALDKRWRPVRIDKSTGAGFRNSDAILPDPEWATRQGIYTLSGRIFAQVEYGARRVAVTWKPGWNTWRVVPLNDATAVHLHAARGETWATRLYSHRWNASESTWDRRVGDEPIPAFEDFIGAEETVFVRDSDTKTLYWKNSNGWSSTDTFDPQQADSGPAADPDFKFGRLYDVEPHDDGYLLAFSRVRDFFDGTGDSAEPDPFGGGLYLWEPGTDRRQRLEFQTDTGPLRPTVSEVEVVDETIWAIVDPLTNPAGENASPLYRINEGQWTHQPYELAAPGVSDVVARSILELREHQGHLYAAMVTDSSYHGSIQVRFDPSTQNFVRMPYPDGVDVWDKFLTDRGPVIATNRRLYRYDGDASRWQPLHASLPRDNAIVSEVTTGNDRLYASTARGGVWSLPLPNTP